MFPRIWNNDEAIQFFEENNYPREYNDGLYAYLRDIYAISSIYSIPSLPDLLKRYLNDYGDTFNMSVTLAKSAVAISLVEPAATFIATTPADGGSGTIVLTSAGAHGLTAAVAVGASIYISAGTGWTVGLYEITALDLDTTGVAITIEGTFNVGMGSPTIALANTLVNLVTIAVPPLLPDSQVRWDVTFTVEPDASAGSEDLIIRYGGQSIQATALTVTNKMVRYFGGFANKGATNAQTNFFLNGTLAMLGNTTSLPNQYTVDSSTTQNLDLAVIPSVANTKISVNRYLIEVFK